MLFYCWILGYRFWWCGCVGICWCWLCSWWLVSWLKLSWCWGFWFGWGVWLSFCWIVVWFVWVFFGWFCFCCWGCCCIFWFLLWCFLIEMCVVVFCWGFLVILRRGVIWFLGVKSCWWVGVVLWVWVLVKLVWWEFGFFVLLLWMSELWLIELIWCVGYDYEVFWLFFGVVLEFLLVVSWELDCCKVVVKKGWVEGIEIGLLVLSRICRFCYFWVDGCERV